jgi:hypothetical protein
MELGRVYGKVKKCDEEAAERWGRGSQVWQAKNLRKGISGSVAMIKLTS